MKSIQTKQQFKPFTHQFGQKFLLPETDVVIQAYPSKILFYQLTVAGSLIKKAGVTLKEPLPLKNWTFEADYFRQELRLFFQSVNGPVELLFKKNNDAVTTTAKKTPSNGLEILIEKQGQDPALDFSELSLQKHEHFQLDWIHNTLSHTSKPKLSLGCQKKQDLQAIQKRGELKESLPLLFALSNFYPNQPYHSEHSLGQDWKKADSLSFSKAAEKFLLGYIDEGLVPNTNIDPNLFLPVSPEKKPPSALGVLAEIRAHLLNSLLQLEGNCLRLLPNLPKEFHCGKLVGLEITPGVFISIEWSKKQIKKAELYTLQAFEFNLALPKDIKTYRFYTKSKKQAQFKNNPSIFQLNAHQRAFFDQFKR